MLFDKNCTCGIGDGPGVKEDGGRYPLCTTQESHGKCTGADCNIRVMSIEAKTGLTDISPRPQLLRQRRGRGQRPVPSAGGMGRGTLGGRDVGWIPTGVHVMAILAAVEALVHSPAVVDQRGGDPTGLDLCHLALWGSVGAHLLGRWPRQGRVEGWHAPGLGLVASMAVARTMRRTCGVLTVVVSCKHGQESLSFLGRADNNLKGGLFIADNRVSHEGLENGLFQTSTEQATSLRTRQRVEDGLYHGGTGVAISNRSKVALISVQHCKSIRYCVRLLDFD
jgi:hypothetical protein